MKLSEKVDQVRSQLSSEDLDKVGALLEEIKSEGISISDSLSAVNSESKNRKIKIKELQDQLETLSIERDDFKNKFEGFDTSTLENEREQYKKKYHSLLDGQRNAFAAALEKVKDHPNWDKAKSMFKMPEEKDGKIDWATLAPEDIEHNINKWSELEKLGYFESQQRGGPEGGKAGAYQPATEIKAIEEKRRAGDPSWTRDYAEYRKRQQSGATMPMWVSGDKSTI